MLQKLQRLLLLSLSLFLLGVSVAVNAQDEPQLDIPTTVGVIQGDHSGYTLMRPQGESVVYLIDGAGRIVHSWQGVIGGRDAWLLEDGNLLISHERVTALPDDSPFEGNAPGFTSIDGAFSEYTWDGELVWTYEFNRPNYLAHHGITPMPNGNVLFIAWEYKSPEEAIAAGRDPALVPETGFWPDVFLEYDPDLDEIVWEWHVWDNLIQDFDPTKDNYGVVADNPHLIDINYSHPESVLLDDWNHVNAVAYNPVLDQIAISAREQQEVWIVDHSRTTEELREDGDGLLYRWGNPQAYDRGTEDDRQIYFQHDVQWVPEGFPGAGNIIMYSNRHRYPVLGGGQLDFSAIVEFTPPLNADGTYTQPDEGQPYEPAEPALVYNGFPDNFFFSNIVSGVQRLPDGNTLVTVGTNATLFEFTPEGEIAWLYRVPFAGANVVPQGATPNGFVFRVRRYQADHPAFEGRDLIPTGTIESFAGTRPGFVGIVTIGDVFAVTLDEAIPQRQYTFTYRDDSPAVISVMVTARDEDTTASMPQLSLLDDGGNTVNSIVETSDNGSVTLRAIVSDGTYNIFATHADGETEAVEYSVALTQEAITISDDFPTLPLSGDVDGFVSGDVPDTVYMFYGVEGQVVSINMEPILGDLIPVMNIQNTSRQIVAEQVSTTNETATISDYTLPYTGVYFVYAGRNINIETPNTQGIYRLTMSVSDE